MKVGHITLNKEKNFDIKQPWVAACWRGSVGYILNFSNVSSSVFLSREPFFGQYSFSFLVQ